MKGRKIMLVLYNNEADTATITLSKTFHLTRNFILEELANNAGDPKEAQYLITKYSIEFNKMLQEFRNRYSTPIIPTSGYRQPAYNANLKDADPNSLHLRACAVDFIDYENKSVYNILNSWISILIAYNNIGAINVYNEGSRKRYHMEAFSDVFKQKTKIEIRVYTSRSDFRTFRAFYEGFKNIEVNYYGS